jgi:hypothetical protein
MSMRRQNLREYASAVAVVILVWLFTRHEANVIVLMSGALMAMGAVYVAFYLHRFGSVRALPQDLALTDCLTFHRTELARQRDLLHNVWWWYLLPLVPGPVFLLIGRAIERPDQRLLQVGVAAICVVTFVGIGKLNDRAARRLQQRIDDLDRAR